MPANGEIVPVNKVKLTKKMVIKPKFEIKDAEDHYNKKLEYFTCIHCKSVPIVAR